MGHVVEASGVWERETATRAAHPGPGTGREWKKPQPASSYPAATTRTCLPWKDQEGRNGAKEGTNDAPPERETSDTTRDRKERTSERGQKAASYPRPGLKVLCGQTSTIFTALPSQMTHHPLLCLCPSPWPLQEQRQQQQHHPLPHHHRPSLHPGASDEIDD